MEGNVNLNYTDNDNAWGGNSTTFLPGGDTYDVTKSITNSSNFNVSTNHLYKKNGKFSFSVNPWFNYHNNDNASTYQNGTFSTLPENYYTEVIDSLFRADNWLADNRTQNVRDLINRYGYRSMQHSRGSNGGVSFWSYFRIPFSPDGISIEADINYSDNNSTYFDHYVRNYTENGAWQDDVRNRYRSSPSNSFGYHLMAKYFWRWTGKIMFNPRYTFNYSSNSSENQNYRLDWLEGNANQPLGWLPSNAAALLEALDPTNSYSSDQHTYNHNITLDWLFQTFETFEGRNRQVWFIQFRPNLTIAKYDYRFFSSPQDQRVQKTYCLPQADFNIEYNTPGNRHYLRLNGELSSTAPSMFNLVDKKFDNDPLNIRLGNPDLKPTQKATVGFGYNARKWLEASGRQLYGNLCYNYYHNAVATSYVYDRTQGVRTNRPVNVNGNWVTWGGLTFTTPLDKKRKFTFTTNSSGSFYHTVDYMSGDANIDPIRTTTRSTNLSESLRFDYRYSILSLGLRGQAGYYRTTADRDDFTDIDTWQLNGGVSAIIDLPWKMQLSTELTYRAIRGYDYNEMNRNDFVWNARLTQRFCKDRLALMLDAWDILGTLTDINNGVNSQTRWAYYTNVIPRYIMLRISYRLDIQPKKR